MQSTYGRFMIATKCVVELVYLVYSSDECLDVMTNTTM